MDLNEAIGMRRSRRRFIPARMDDDTVASLHNVVVEQGRRSKCRMEFVVNHGAAFAGLTRSYGMFTGVRHYVGLICEAGDKLAIERLGYFGEIVLLHAVGLGLGTCWVGGSFARRLCPFTLSEDERIACVIVVGPVEPDPSARERMIRDVIHRHTKTVEQMSTSDGPTPDWFATGMRAVQKAPSAVHRQPVFFEYRDGVVSASVPESNDDTYLLDLGIAKLHFEVGAGGGTWEWGNGGSFTR